MKAPIGALTALLTVGVTGGSLYIVKPEIGTLLLLAAPLLAVTVELATMARTAPTIHHRPKL